MARQISVPKCKNTAACLCSERGDVPGWVLITLMTAGLVVAIWASAAPALDRIMDESFSRVAGF